MAATLQVISGVVVLDKKVGHAEVDFDEGIITGDVNVDTSDVRGPRRNFHIPPNLVVERVTAHRKPPEVRIWRLSNQSRVGTVPPSTSTPHCPPCRARRW
jgi:hypothetical protein